MLISLPDNSSTRLVILYLFAKSISYIFSEVDILDAFVEVTPGRFSDKSDIIIDGISVPAQILIKLFFMKLTVSSADIGLTGELA